MVNENLYVHTKYSMRSEGTIIQCGTVNALRFFQAEVVIDFYLVAVLPHLALKTPNHFETRVEASSTVKGFDGFRHLCEKEMLKFHNW